MKISEKLIFAITFSPIKKMIDRTLHLLTLTAELFAVYLVALRAEKKRYFTSAKLHNLRTTYTIKNRSCIFRI